MRKTLRKWAIRTAVIGSLFLPNFVNSQDMPGKLETNKEDVSAQPRNTTLCYGSGDIDSNGVVDIQDLTMFDNSLEQIIADSTSKGKRNRADVNADSKVDSLDRQFLKRFVDGEIGYLPGHWNKLTPEEQLNWFTRVMAIDTENKKKWIKGQWVSGNFAVQTHINTNGVDVSIPSIYDSTTNRKFNIPLYFAGRTNPGHGANAINIGNTNGGDPRLPENWIYFEPQNDGQVRISELGTYYKNCEVWIGPVKGFIDSGTDNPGSYIPWLVKFKIIDGIASLLEYDSTSLDLDKVTGIKDLQNVGVPREFVLQQNYPNPFNPRTTIRYELPKDAKVFLEVYDIAGRRLETLVDGEMQKTGKHEIPWDASGFSSGAYICRIRTGEFEEAREMMLVR